MINYNGNSDSDLHNNIKFVDIDLPCNKRSIQLLANDSITCIKKRHVLKTEEKAIEPFEAKVTWEKKTPVKLVEKKSSKESIPISGLVGKLPLDIQTLFMNTNIVILVLDLIQISLKFCEEIRC